MNAHHADRVSRNTCHAVNERIARQTEANIGRYTHARPYEIEQRLHELDHEWDIERYLETMAPMMTLAGLGLSLKVHKKFLLIPLAVQAMFLLHAVQGWCPPLPILRRLGIRTKDEIDREKYALKALRGDFSQMPQDTAAPNRRAAAWRAVGA